jgi:hypothetical protein
VFDARLTTLLCKEIIVAKTRELKTECNLTESSERDYGPNMDVFANGNGDVATVM